MTGQTAEQFDYIIIGGGSAGSLLAARLTETGGGRVCVLESGPSDWHPYVRIPAGYIRLLFDKRMTWGFPSATGGMAEGRSILLPQGRMYGGSSSINGMVYNRGQRLDFDSWAALGNPGWSFDEVLPYFRRSEQRFGFGDPEYRGREGALPVTDLEGGHPLCEIFAEGAAQLGLPRNPDYNGASQFGSGYAQRVIRRGLRVSAARAFLHPAMRRDELDVRPHAHVTRIIVENGRATGVDYLKGAEGGQIRRVMARREVILAAGAVGSPRLLQLSGIGAPDHLRGLGLSVTHALPGVGENFRDHYAARLVARVKGIETLNARAKGLRLGLEIGKWLIGRPSIISVTPAMFYVFAKSDPALASPDIQCSFTPASYKEGYLGVLDDFPGVTCGPYQQRPESAGRVRITSADPFATPLVDPNYLAHELDRKVLIAGIRLGRALLSSPAMQPWLAAEEIPGRDCLSDDEILDFARQKGSTAYHLVGSCKMGPREDPMAVVDAELRLHGLAGLRIADSSVMPTMPSANTYAATLMIAEKAADMILGRSAV